jgi:polyhydroxyalkanoate synthesis regulator phasin
MAKWWHTPWRRRHDEVVAWLREILRRQEQIMATAADIKALIAEIGDDLQEVIDKLEAATGGLTAEEAQEIADLLKPIAAKVPEPEAPPEG